MLKKLLICISSIVYIGIAHATVIKIVAAENFYGELATEIGGASVEVKSIISNPNADPHLFSTSPSVSMALAKAQIIIYNGANYDPWMDQMLKSLNNKNARIINVADLMGIKSGTNPHIWYQPNTFPTLAKKLALEISTLDAISKSKIEDNLTSFLAQNKKVTLQIEKIKTLYNNTAVTATEPVFGYMAQSMGLSMQGIDFQWKIMNNTQPSPQMLAAYENLITKHKVRLLFYNKQVVDPTIKNILKLAQENKIPLVGITETMPKNTTINKWLLDEINNTLKALQDK